MIRSTPMKKPLVLYFSVYGTAKSTAEEIARQTGADLAEIEPAVPYDGDRNRLPYGHAFRLENNRKPEAAFYWRDSRDAAIMSSVCSYNHISAAQEAMTANSYGYVLDPDTGMAFKHLFNDDNAIEFDDFETDVCVMAKIEK